MLPRVLPMKAVPGGLPATDDGWAYEIKWDGMRIVAYVGDHGRPLLLETTRGLDATPRFPELAALPGALEPHAAILDGEVVAFDGSRPSFERLQHRMHVADPREALRLSTQYPICYVVFDLLQLDGHDLTGQPYVKRRALLHTLLDDGAAWRVPRHHTEGGAELLAAVTDQGLEGLVAKRQQSAYLPGKRSPTWRKIKVRNRQEVVIGGWQPGTGNRAGTIGSLIVGYHDGDDLRYAGKVGTGFGRAELDRLDELLAALERSASPFTPPPPATIRRTARWTEPEVVCEVAFGHWTEDGVLRHASYEGLRIDKDPADVVRET